MQQVNARRYWIGLTPVSVIAVSLALIFGVLWFLGNPGQVYACSCAQPGSPSEELRESSAVFAGKVVSVRHTYDPDGRSVSRDDHSAIGFEVSAVWKGTVYEDMVITTPPTGGSCGFRFVEGEEYIVYAYDGPYVDGGYSVGICTRTALLEQAQEDIDELGEGRAPQAGTGGPAPAAPEDTAVDSARDVILAVFERILELIGVVVYALVGCR